MSDTHDREIAAAFAVTEHRPWPLPDAPWIMYQRWERLLFAHWPVDAGALRAHVPPPLAIDRFEGKAWLSIAAFEIEGLRARGVRVAPGVWLYADLSYAT